jgi:hypothetical protein
MRKQAPKEVTSTGVDHEDVYVFLDELRDSGETNMFGAEPYVREEFEIPRSEARKLVTAWMGSF